MNGARKLWDFIKYYHLIILLALGVLMIVFRNQLFDIVCAATDVAAHDPFYEPLSILFDATLIGIWLFISFKTIRDKRYYKLTGRNYGRDHADFRKPYSVLVDFFTKNDTYKMNVEELPIEDWKDADGVILCKYKDVDGHYRLVKKDSMANGNLCCFGRPGCGKTTTQAATTAIRFNANLKPGGCGVFAISIKGDLLKFVEGKRTNIKVFTPDKAEGSCHYDVFEGIEEMSPTERRTFVDNLSRIINPEEKGENSTFFVNGARDYLCSICHYLIYLHESGEREGHLNFPELVDLIIQSEVFEITLTIHDSGCKIAKEYTDSYIGSNEKNVSGIYNHLVKQVRPFNAGALRTLFDGQGDCISPDDLEEYDVYIDVPQDKYQIYSPCMAIITSNFLQAFQRRKDVASGQQIRPILMMLDEFIQLKIDFDLLSQAMSTLRSKKISLFLLLQSVASLENRYGEDQTREIIDLCSYISVFNAQDPKSREYFQKLVGKRKMLKKNTSLSSSSSGQSTNQSSGTNVNEEEEFIFHEADFGDLNLKKGKKIIHRVLVYAEGKYILGETTPYYE